MAIVSSIMQAGSSVKRVKHQNLEDHPHYYCMKLIFGLKVKNLKDTKTGNFTYICSNFKELLYARDLAMHCS